MTDDETIAAAEAIIAKRKREARAKAIMGAGRIELSAFTTTKCCIETLRIEPSPEFYAFLCHLFQIGDSK